MNQTDPIPGPLRVLHLEDNDSDAELVEQQMAHEGLGAVILRTRDREEYTQALRQEPFDLILADCHLTAFDGFEALGMARKGMPGTPFIFVSGTLGEELAVQGLKQGAVDYVLKDQLARLGPAARRAVRESREHAARGAAHARLRRSELGLASLAQGLSSAATRREAAEIIVSVADDLLGWDACSLDLLSAERDALTSILTLDIVDGRRTLAPPPEEERRVFEHGMFMRVEREGGQLILRERPPAFGPELRPFGDRERPSASLLFVPVRKGATTIGMFSIQSYTAEAYGPEDLTTLQALADHCGGALERIRAEEKVVTLNSQLLHAARLAGMEEVATSVLHSVGNTLNSVNVSATIVMEGLGSSKLDGLRRLGELLPALREDPVKFLAENPQGRQLPQYLQALAGYWAEEKSGWLRELEGLVKNINHIKEIVARQQSLTGTFGFAEPVQIAELVEDALIITGVAAERSGIAVARDFRVQATLLLDKMKLMRILVNLVNNARDALLESATLPRHLQVRTECSAEGALRLLLTDNGTGIAPENLTRIFSHGFTTKRNGHGFGLHSSALAAREMGGSLHARSDGSGKGACLTLELPLLTAARGGRTA